MSNGRRGSVRQAENGSWGFVIDVPTTELGPTGRPKRKQTRRRGFKTRREAQAELNRVLATLDEHAYVAPQNQTLAEYLREIWLPAVEHTLKPSTFQSYARVIRRHVAERAIGGRRLQQVDGPMLNRHYALLLAGDERNGYTALGPKTVRYCSEILHRAFRDAVRWHAVSRNPVEDSDPPRPPKRREMTTWSAVELNTFLRSVEEHRHSALWWVLGTTGMRRGEALGLKWADVRWQTREVVIRRALIVSETQPYMWSTPKTAAGWRTVVLDHGTVAVLKAHRARQNEEKLALGSGYDDADLITACPTGKPINPNHISEKFQRLLKQAELPRIRLHDLRHTHATLALEAGIHPRVVQERLGHSHVSVTLGIYSHVNTTMQVDAADRLELLRQTPEPGGGPS